MTDWPELAPGREQGRCQATVGGGSLSSPFAIYHGRTLAQPSQDSEFGPGKALDSLVGKPPGSFSLCSLHSLSGKDG